MKSNNTKSGANPYVYPAVDWLNELFKKRTNNQRANLNVSGGGKTSDEEIIERTTHLMEQGVAGILFNIKIR